MIQQFKLFSEGFKAPAGEIYCGTEAHKGELGFYLISDGSPNPYRYRVRPPSFINLTILEDMCLGQHVADVAIADGVIVVHNHPSGDPTPSPEDVRVTHQIVDAGKLLNIDVLDHLVIGLSRWVSLKEKGMGFS